MLDFTIEESIYIDIKLKDVLLEEREIYFEQFDLSLVAPRQLFVNPHL